MLMVLGIGCLALGVALVIERLVFLARSEGVTGEITVKEAARYSVRFEQGGQIVQITRPLPVDKDEREALKVGGKLALRVQPGAAQDARSYGLDFWFFPAGLLLVGALGVFASRYMQRAPTEPLS
jgi:hypothetical protein